MRLTPTIHDRVHQLIVDGYLELNAVTRHYCLTDKGMTVLLACADSPQKVAKLAKPSLAFERLWSATDRVRQLGK